MSLRSALLGSKLRIAGTAVLGLVVVGVGLYALGVLGVPAVVGVQNAFGPVNASMTVIETDLVVNNPNPIGVRLGGVSVDYTVSMNDLAMANGTKRGVGVGTGNSTLTFTTLMNNERIPAWWASHVGGGERTQLGVDATVCSETIGRCITRSPVNRTIETDLTGGFNSTETRPVNASVPLVSDPVAYINRTSAHWGTVTRAETPLAISFTVYNPKTVPLAVSELGYNVTMNDVDVGEGRVEDPAVIPPKSTQTVRTTVVIDNDRLDEWWVTHLERDQVTDLVIDFYARVELGTTTVRVPLRGLTHEKTIETDFFGTKDDDGPGGGGDGSTTTTAPSTTDGGLLGTTSDGLVNGTTDDGLLNGTTTEGGLLDDGTTTTTDGSADDGTTTTTDGSADGATTTTDDGLLEREAPA